MAGELLIADIGSLKAAADLSTKQYYIVLISAADKVNLCGNGGEAIGILQNKPAADGRSAQVRTMGISQIEWGATVAAGARVMSDANGEGITATAGKKFIGRAIEGGDVGDRGTILMEHGYVPAA